MSDVVRVKRYHRARRILGVAGFLVDLAVLGALLFTGWTVSLRAYALSWTERPALALLIYVALFGVITKVVGSPLDYARSFVIEHRYGLSNLTLGAWLKDELKALLVGGALSALALEGLYATMRRWPQHWWMVAGALFVGLFVVLANLAPILILPIFFKFKPLERPALVERLLDLSRRAGTRVKGVFEWKLSEKTKKANAALVGLGNTRRILVADTLLEKFTDDEVAAVLAHELGHHVHHHVFNSLVVQTGATFLGFYLVQVALGRFSGYFGFRGAADFANLPLLIIVGTVLALALLPAVNALSRAMERQADAYALAATGTKAAFISGMEKLAELNLAERRPPGWIEFIFHSHPSIDKRITFAERFPG